MATVKVILKANKVDEKGEMPLYLRITKNRKAKFISIGIKVHPDLWDEPNQRVKKKYPNATKVNAFIAKKVSEAECTAVGLETSKKYVSSKKIKEEIMGKASVSLIKYIEDFQATTLQKGKMGTHDKVNAVLLKLKTYLNNADIYFDEFDLDFVKKYEKYMRDVLGNKPNTIHSNLKIFRKFFNDAIREDLIEAHLNPFTKYKLSWEKTNRAYLNDEELLAIEKLELKENTIMFHHKNMYVFAAYAGGIRISDLLQLRWCNYDGTHVRIFTQKTKESISVKLPSKAIEILEYYKSLNPDTKTTDFIFPFLSNTIDYSNPSVLFKAISSNTAYANKNLKTIATKAELTKSISFHSSRHSFATRALQKGMRIEYVSKLLGHSTIKTTQIYTKIVNSDLDNAMSIFN